MARRLEALLVEEGAAVELVRGVLRQRGANPALAAASVRELQVIGRPSRSKVVEVKAGPSDAVDSRFQCMCSVVLPDA